MLKKLYTSEHLGLGVGVCLELTRRRRRYVIGIFCDPPMRGQRLASKVLKFVTDEADRSCETLRLLVISTIDASDIPPCVLINWYERNGFKTTQKSSYGTWMRRLPKSRQQSIS